MTKYRAKRTLFDGIWFDSKKEALRYQELKLLERAREITDLELQPEFLIHDKFKFQSKVYREIKYIADFQYKEKGNPSVLVVEDVKGIETPVFKMKWKMTLARYANYKYDFRIVK